MASVPVVLGITSTGELLCQGITLEGTSTSAIHHVSSSNKFEAESWTGEHEAEQFEEPRRDSLAFDLGEQQKDEDTPIASSSQFERKRTDSLAAALLDVDPTGKPIVLYFRPEQHIFEVTEEGEEGSVGDAEQVLANLLFTLRALKMSAGDKHAAAVQRLRELEEELREAGAVTPADPAVADAVARALAASGPGRDIQIRVNQSRHTTTTKTVYETETPGMVGLDSEKIRELQKQMLESLTSGGMDSSVDSGTTQKKETAEEGFTNEDGSVVVSKKMTRVVTTTKTTLPGEGENLGE